MDTKSQTNSGLQNRFMSTSRTSQSFSRPNPFHYENLNKSSSQISQGKTNPLMKRFPIPDASSSANPFEGHDEIETFKYEKAEKKEEDEKFKEYVLPAQTTAQSGVGLPRTQSYNLLNNGQKPNPLQYSYFKGEQGVPQNLFTNKLSKARSGKREDWQSANHLPNPISDRLSANPFNQGDYIRNLNESAEYIQTESSDLNRRNTAPLHSSHSNILQRTHQAPVQGSHLILKQTAPSKIITQRPANNTQIPASSSALIRSPSVPNNIVPNIRPSISTVPAPSETDNLREQLSLSYHIIDKLNSKLKIYESSQDPAALRLSQPAGVTPSVSYSSAAGTFPGANRQVIQTSNGENKGMTTTNITTIVQAPSEFQAGYSTPPRSGVTSSHNYGRGPSDMSKKMKEANNRIRYLAEQNDILIGRLNQYKKEKDLLKNELDRVNPESSSTEGQYKKDKRELAEFELEGLREYTKKLEEEVRRLSGNYGYQGISENYESGGTSRHGLSGAASPKQASMTPMSVTPHELSANKAQNMTLLEETSPKTETGLTPIPEETGTQKKASSKRLGSVGSGSEAAEAIQSDKTPKSEKKKKKKNSTHEDLPVEGEKAKKKKKSKEAPASDSDQPFPQIQHMPVIAGTQEELPEFPPEGQLPEEADQNEPKEDKKKKKKKSKNEAEEPQDGDNKEKKKKKKKDAEEEEPAEGGQEKKKKKKSAK